MDDLAALKKSLIDLHSWVQNDLDLDNTKRRQIESVKAQLQALENRSAPVFALIWSYGKLLIAEIDHEKLSPSTLQTILSIFVKSLNSSDLAKSIDVQRNLWEILFRSDYVKSLIKISPENPSCLYKTFLTNCFQNVGNLHFGGAMVDLVMATRVPCLLGLVEQKQHKALYPILDSLLVQLVDPLSVKAQDTAKSLLKSCGWRIANSIREMLNGALVGEDKSLKHFVSHLDVYKIILELLLIDKDLVLGLINNTELCLTSRRKDRLEGLDFFCRLFGSKLIPGVSKPSELYSHLWETFLFHCRSTSLYEPNELMILAKYTPDILCRTDTHDAWCSLLFFLFQFYLPKKCETEFVSGITNAVRSDLSLLLKSGRKSLSQLIKNFLSPESEYGRNDGAWQCLMRDLSDIYLNTAKTGILNLQLIAFHKSSSWLLSCLIQTCSAMTPFNEKWCMLRKIFVKKLVPYDMAEIDRMKMYLYLWINTDSEDRSILHELFLRTKEARENVRHILRISLTKDSLQKGMSLLTAKVAQLSHILITVPHISSSEFLSKQFFPVLGTIPETRILLHKLLFGVHSCSENFQNTARLKTLFLATNNIDIKVLDGLLFYLSEVTFDTLSMQKLIELVNSCVIGDSISSAMGENHLLGIDSLHLLSETIFMNPKMGLNVDVLNCIQKCSQPSNGSLSMLALRCLISLSPFHLDSSCYSYFIKMLPVWLDIIVNGSRSCVKMAIRCVALHSSTARDENLAKVLDIILRNLNDSDEEAFERGVSALGHFAAFCPSSLKNRVEKCCFSVLFKVVFRQFSQEISSAHAVASSTSNNSWVDWKELPYHTSIKVQALRSIGRCIRDCGTLRSVSTTLEAFEKILLNSGNAMCNLREIDKDRLRCEAATAILLIFETPQFWISITERLILLLSNVITDPRFEVRHIFAGKLVQGLCIHKIRSSKTGRSRGLLPPCMLGLLALLGSNVWMETSQSKAMAEAMLKEVCVSRQIAFARRDPYSRSLFFEKHPEMVLEIIFVAAAPIIAEHSMLHVTLAWSFSDRFSWKDNEDLILGVAGCFNLIQRMVCHPETCGGQVSKVYIQNMFDKAKQSIFSTVKQAMAKVYCVVFELLEFFLKLYVPEETDAPTPPVQLPLPFYSERHREPIENRVSILSETDLNEILRYSTRKRKIDHNENEQEDAEVVDLNETESDVLEDDSNETESDVLEDDSSLNKAQSNVLEDDLSLNETQSNVLEDDSSPNSRSGESLNNDISINLDRSSYTQHFHCAQPLASSSIYGDSF